MKKYIGVWKKRKKRKKGKKGKKYSVSCWVCYMGFYIPYINLGVLCINGDKGRDIFFPPDTRVVIERVDKGCPINERG